MSKLYCGRCESWIEGTYLEHDKRECALLQLRDKASQIEGLKAYIEELEDRNDKLTNELNNLGQP